MMVAERAATGPSLDSPEIPATMTTRGHVVLTLRFWLEGKRWVGECVELGTATDASTLKRTQAALADLILLHLNTLEETGERERFFAQQGITFYQGPPPLEFRPAVPSVPVGSEFVTRVQEFPVSAAA